MVVFETLRANEHYEEHETLYDRTTSKKGAKLVIKKAQKPRNNGIRYQNLQKGRRVIENPFIGQKPSINKNKGTFMNTSSSQEAEGHERMV